MTNTNDTNASVPIEQKSKTTDKGKDNKQKQEELSEEDLALKEGLELAVTRLQENDEGLHKPALDHLINEIKSATSSMTSVPKPLKFLRPYYEDLKKVYDSWLPTHAMKSSLADVLSVLAMTMAATGSRECLNYKLAGNTVNVSSWGHEYVRSLAGEIAEEFNQRINNSPNLEIDTIFIDDLMILIDDIVPFQMKHNAEAEAVDLLMETSQLEKLYNSTPSVVDDRNYERVCLYLIRSANYVADPEDLIVLYQTTYQIYKQQHKYTDALRIALKIDKKEWINEIFHSVDASERVIKLQMAFILARHRYPIEFNDPKVDEIISNLYLSKHYLDVAKSLDIMAPKLPEDIYKTEKPDRRNGGLISAAAGLDTAKSNLAASFTNAFVNAAYNQDKLMTIDEKWIGKNKDHGISSTVASLGMIMMWNVEEGLNILDKYLSSTDPLLKAGACLGIGIASSGIRNESDATFALLNDILSTEKIPTNIRVASICGLGISYAGSQRVDIQELFENIIINTEMYSMEEASYAALSLGLIFVGTCNDDISSAIIQRLMESSPVDLNLTVSRFLCLALGLLYLGKGEQADIALETLRTIEHPRGKYAVLTLEISAYAGSGNVLKVQEMLRVCTDHLTEGAEHQAVAVLGIALIAFGEEVGTDMTLRTFEHLLHYGELPVRRVVPLALALLYLSNPEYTIIDQMSRLTHDADPEVAMNAILGLGLISAGSNNSRVTTLLRQLADFYAKEPNHTFLIRVAQGLNSMGKGLLTICPFHSDRLLLNGPAMGGLLTIFHACLDIKNTILDKYHYLLYFLTPAMNPRYLYTVNPELQATSVTVRVGQAVETVGQAGRPKTITGFQTHTTPVLLGYKDRAELVGSENIAKTSVLEGVVIIETIPTTEQPKL